MITSMDDPAISDRDRLKFVRAFAMAGCATARGVLEGSPDLMASIVADGLLEAVCWGLDSVLPDEDETGWYSTGLPVFTIASAGPDCPCEYLYVWAPNPRHERNQPRVLQVLDCPRGGSHRFVTVAAGEIEVLNA